MRRHCPAHGQYNKEAAERRAVYRVKLFREIVVSTFLSYLFCRQIQRRASCTMTDLAFTQTYLDDDGFAASWTPTGFPMALDLWCLIETPRCLQELQILECIGVIRDKPQWHKKISDNVFVAECRDKAARVILDKADAGGSIASTNLESRLKSLEFHRIWNYALQECQYCAQDPNMQFLSAVENVFQQDFRDEFETIRLGILHNIETLRQRMTERNHELNRHPGAEQMVDWVHPSLYAFRKTLNEEEIPFESFDDLDHAQEDCLALVTKSPSFQDVLGKEISLPPLTRRSETRRGESRYGFQRLPSEFCVSEEREFDNESTLACHINSYISGLHPVENADMYDNISNMFALALPLLEKTLSFVRVVSSHSEASSGRHKMMRQRAQRINVPRFYGDLISENESPVAQNLFGNASDDEEEDEKPLSIPSSFTEPEFSHPLTTIKLRNRPLQVTVKLASLELGPHESFSGGHWHVEGMMDDRIVATACCYLEQDNVQGGDLEFLTSIQRPPMATKKTFADDDDDEWYDDDYWKNLIFGYREDDPLIQSRGACSTPIGRILVWPNVLQHRVQPVSLVDANQPGRRTYLCFFLVDPTLRIRSTATVPPSPFRWVEQFVHEILAPLVPEMAVRNKILDFVKALPCSDGHPSHLLTYQEAMEQRQTMVNERHNHLEKGEGTESARFYSPTSLNMRSAGDNGYWACED